MSKRSYERRIQAKRAADRAARKRAERMRKFRVWTSAVAAIVVALVLFLVFRGDGTKPAASPTPSVSAGPCTGPTPAGPPSGKQYPDPPANSIDANKIYVATLKTNCGDFKIQMDPKTAPKTVNNFVFLARENFYDGVVFHRIEDEPGSYAIIQGGDPQGTGQGGPGYSYDGETPAPTAEYPRGTVAMANSKGPSTNGSQFFVVVRDWPGLPANYTIFGKIIDDTNSFATLQKIVSLKSPGSSDPVTPIYIVDVTIEELART